jgi:hypothetical protein
VLSFIEERLKELEMEKIEQFIHIKRAVKQNIVLRAKAERGAICASPIEVRSKRLLHEGLAARQVKTTHNGCQREECDAVVLDENKRGASPIRAAHET